MLCYAVLHRRYAIVCTHGNHAKAEATLQRQQREQVSFARNMIWRDMVGRERARATVTVQVRKELNM